MRETALRVRTEIGQPTRPQDCEIDGRSAKERFLAAVAFLCLAWSAVATRHRGAVAQWLSNDMLPGAGVWVLVLAGYTIWCRKTLLARSPQVRKGPIGSWILIAAVLLLILWTQPTSAVVAHYLSLLAGIAFLHGIGASSALRVMFPAMAIVTFLPALSPSAYRHLGQPIQELVAAAVTPFCRFLLAADYVRNGTDILCVAESGHEVLVAVRVEAECSGYRSLIGVTLMALVWGSNPRSSIRQKLMLLGCAFGLAFLGNLLRVASSIALHHHGLTELASGMAHAALGQGLVLLEIIGLFALWRVLLRRTRIGLKAGERAYEAD